MESVFAYVVWLPAVAAAFYLGLPLLIYFQQKFPAHPEMLELDLEDLDRALAKFLMTRTRALVALGFDEPTTVQIPDAVPNVSSYLIMLVNRQAGDKAMVTVLIAGGPAPMQTAYVEYSTRFEDGVVFDTLNSDQLNAFPPARQAVRTQTPTVSDPAELYRMHQFQMSKHDGGAKKVVYGRGGGLNYLTSVVLIDSYDKQVERGWLKYDSRTDAYRTTLKGAYLIVWGLVQPFKALRTLAMRSRENRVLRDFRKAAAG